MRDQAPHSHALGLIDREIYRTFDALLLQAAEVLTDKTDRLRGVNGCIDRYTYNTFVIGRKTNERQHNSRDSR